MNDTILGKISNVQFGIRDGRFGLWLILEGTWGTQTEHTTWDPETVEVTEHTKWTEFDRDIELSKIMHKISKLLNEAKIDDIYKLKNIPVEFTSENGRLKDWRILTEVL